MLESAGTLSINRFTGNGATTSWNINFAGGYMQQADVKAYTTVGNVNTVVAVSWIGANTVSITPAVPNGVQLTIYRDTRKDIPVVDFTDGAIVNELNLDTLAKQAVFCSAEMVDRFSVVNDKSDNAVTTANNALAIANTAISNTALIVGGDFTKFGRTDVAASWTAQQTFSAIVVPTRTAGDSTTFAASTAFVTGALSTALSSYSTTAQMNTAISTAASGAQSAAIAAAATDATTKANAAQAAAIAAVDPDWLYTLAAR